MIDRKYLKELLERNHAILARMNASPDPKIYASLAREYASSNLGAIAEKIKEFLDIEREIEELRSLDTQEEELRELAQREMAQLCEKIKSKEQELTLLLMPKDEDEEKPAILEVRAGTGGAEAALFAGDLFRMYQRYAETRGWKCEIMSASPSEAGGYKEIIASISGRSAYARLRHESGTHRVQRVPETESSGRIHTSAATVAVLPQAEDIDVSIDEEKDLEIQVFRSSGPGGQSVNTTDSAVRIRHLPTGMVVSQQDEKSQHRNRAKAMRILRSRIYAARREQKERERAAIRRDKVGSGDRSERIRTYNYPQGRVTDHRIDLTVHKLPRILDGQALDEIVEALVANEQSNRLDAMNNGVSSP